MLAALLAAVFNARAMSSEASLGALLIGGLLLRYPIESHWASPFWSTPLAARVSGAHFYYDFLK